MNDKARAEKQLLINKTDFIHYILNNQKRYNKIVLFNKQVDYHSKVSYKMIIVYLKNSNASLTIYYKDTPTLEYKQNIIKIEY